MAQPTKLSGVNLCLVDVLAKRLGRNIRIVGYLRPITEPDRSTLIGRCKWVKPMASLLSIREWRLVPLGRNR